MRLMHSSVLKLHCHNSELLMWLFWFSFASFSALFENMFLNLSKTKDGSFWARFVDAVARRGRSRGNFNARRRLRASCMRLERWASSPKAIHAAVTHRAAPMAGLLIQSAWLMRVFKLDAARRTASFLISLQAERVCISSGRAHSTTSINVAATIPWRARRHLHACKQLAAKINARLLQLHLFPLENVHAGAKIIWCVHNARNYIILCRRVILVASQSNACCSILISADDAARVCVTCIIYWTGFYRSDEKRAGIKKEMSNVLRFMKWSYLW